MGGEIILNLVELLRWNPFREAGSGEGDRFMLGRPLKPGDLAGLVAGGDFMGEEGLSYSRTWMVRSQSSDSSSLEPNRDVGRNFFNVDRAVTVSSDLIEAFSPSGDFSLLFEERDLKGVGNLKEVEG